MISLTCCILLIATFDAVGKRPCVDAFSPIRTKTTQRLQGHDPFLISAVAVPVRGRRSTTLQSSDTNTNTRTTPIIPATTPSDRHVKVQQVLKLARRIGPVGSISATPEEQEQLLMLCRQLLSYSDPAPTSVVLEGVHDLVYSASPGGSSGRLGKTPWYGKVQQEFLQTELTADEEILSTPYINSVQFGPIQISLQATARRTDAFTNVVKFHQTQISCFGQVLFQKEMQGGGGFWKYLFLGTIVDSDGTQKLVRIMETPSLFVLEQQV